MKAYHAFPSIFRTLALAALLAMSLAAHHARAETPAKDAQRVVLKPVVNVDQSLVTLSDLVIGYLPDGDTALFRAPAPGSTGSVKAHRIISAVQQLGYVNVDAPGFAAVSVTRNGRRISPQDIQASLSRQFARLGYAKSADNVMVRLDDPRLALTIETDVTGSLEVRDFAVTPHSRRFQALLNVAGSTVLQGGVPVTGVIEETAAVPVLIRAMSRGDTISESDLSTVQIPVSRIGEATMIAPEQIAGRAARRAIRANLPIGEGDIMAPIIVERNALVSIIYRSNGLTLSVRGRSMADASRGDMVSAMNLQSNRMVQGMVTDDGRIVVGGNMGM